MIAPASAPLPTADPPVPQLAGAWVRYGARMADILLFTAILDRTPLWSVWVPQWLGRQTSNPLLYGVLASLLWVPLETLTLRLTGRTPGKWLFGVVVRRVDGSALSVWTCLVRTMMVFAGGLGFGIRPLAIVCFLFGYGRLMRGRATVWDNACGSQVLQDDPSITRLAIGAVVTLALLWLVVEGRMNAQPSGNLLIA